MAQQLPISQQGERDVKKLGRLVPTVVSLSIAAIVGSAGVANANTDSYTYDHVEVGAANNGGSPQAWICSYQSSPNWFKFWVHSVGTGGNLYLTPATSGWYMIDYGNNVNGIHLNPGECKFVNMGSEYTVQVFGGSGSLSWGTNPIPWSP